VWGGVGVCVGGWCVWVHVVCVRVCGVCVFCSWCVCVCVGLWCLWVCVVCVGVCGVSGVCVLCVCVCVCVDNSLKVNCLFRVARPMV